MRAIIFLFAFISSFSYANTDTCLGPEYFGKYANFAQSKGAKVSYTLQVIDKKSGTILCHNGWNKNGIVYPASTMKVFVVAAALSLVDQNVFEMSQIFEIDQVNANTDCGNKPCGVWSKGYRASLQKMMSVTIRYSNNITTNQLIDIVGKEYITRFAQKFGAKNTKIVRKVYATVNPEPNIHERNETTSFDLASFYYNLYFNKNFLSAESRQYLLRLLKTTTHNNRLNLHIKHKYDFYHKTGSTSRSASDAGFLHLNENQIVIISALQESKKRIPRGRRWDFALLARMGKEIIKKLEDSKPGQ